MPHRWLNWLPLALLTLTLLALGHRFLLGEALFWGLPSLQFYPWRDFAMSQFAQGRFPLWNPYNGAGAPLLANYQSALLYPPHLLYFLSNTPAMMGWIALLHLWWAGFGMWLLARRVGAGWLGSGIAALAYPLSGTLVARLGTFPMIESAAWLAWLVLAADRLIERPSLLRTLALALVVAMQLLTGHAQWTFYSFVLAGGFGLWRVVTLRQTWRNLLRLIAAAGLALALAVGLTAAQLLPTAELQRQSQRVSGVDETFALNFSFAPLSLITLLNPNFFGNPGDGSYSIGGVYYETAAYIGFLPVTLALLGTGRYVMLWRRKRRGLPNAERPDSPRSLIPFFALVTVIALVLALGKFGIYPLLYRYVPTFNLFQAPARWLLLAAFSLTMLAALACPLWQYDLRTARRARWGLVIGASLLIAGGAALVLFPQAGKVVAQMARGIVGLGALSLITALIFLLRPRQDSQDNPRWQAAVLIVVTLDLLWANTLSNPTVPSSFYDRANTPAVGRVFHPDSKNQPLPDSVFEQYLRVNDYRVALDKQAEYRRALLPNLNLLDRQPVLNNFDPLRPERLERFTRLLNDALRDPAQQEFSRKLLRAAAVNRVPGQIDGPPLPRMWVVQNVIWVENADEAEKAMRDPAWNPETTAILEMGESEKVAFQKGLSDVVQIVEDTPSRLVLKVDGPGVLVLADSYYPGWLAAGDSLYNSTYRANLAFRAVYIYPGQRTLSLVYAPNSFWIGLLISVGSSVLCLILAVRGWRGRQDNKGAG